MDQVDRISYLLTKLATAAATRLHLHVNNLHCSFISSSERENLLWKSSTSEVKHVEPKICFFASTNVCKVSIYNFASQLELEFISQSGANLMEADLQL